MDDHQHPALEQILDACLDAIATQGWSVDDCLAQYPAYSNSLKPLLSAAQKLSTARHIGPSAAFRQQSIMRLRSRLSTPAPRQIPQPARRAIFPAGRMLAGALATVLVVAGLTVMITVIGSAPKGELVQPATSASAGSLTTSDSGGSVTSQASSQSPAVTGPVAGAADTDKLGAEVDSALQELDNLNTAADKLDDEP